MSENLQNRSYEKYFLLSLENDNHFLFDRCTNLVILCQQAESLRDFFKHVGLH
ncbi:hypothetical protein C8N37_103510 [Sphingobacterium faecium]|nr:hypothetical protein C8N37_103510 [Sphingobacterium faecium]